MKIVIAGNFGAKNLGDEMILDGMISMLREILPDPRIIVLSGDPDETSQRHGIKGVKMVPAGFRSILFDRKKDIKAIKKCKYFILGGGGLFGSLKFKANIIWAVQAFTAYFYKKPVLCLGQSVGPITNFFLKKLVSKVFQKSKLIVVRDNESKTNLQNIGVTKEIFVYPDFAFYKNIRKTENRSNTVVVALRQMEGLDDDFIEEISKFLNYLHEKENKKIQFINFQEGPNSDQILHERILPKVNGVVEQIKTEEIEEVENAFRKSSLVLGMRLHSIITALKTSTPFIAINYASKVKSFLKYAGYESLMIDLEDIRFDELKSLYRRAKNKEIRFTKELDRAQSLIKSSLLN